MAGFFKKLSKWGLIGLGTVLSLINPAIGAPLIVAGSAIKIDSNSSQDLVSVYGANLYSALDTANAMQSGANVNTLINKILVFLQKNFVIIAISVLALFLLPKFLKRRRR